MNPNIKFHIISDKTKTSQYIKKNILKKISKHKLSKSNRIMVIGGDGFMLNSLKKYYKFKKPFYGLNAGSYGFLMNKYSKAKTSANKFNKEFKLTTLGVNQMPQYIQNNQIKYKDWLDFN